MKMSATPAVRLSAWAIVALALMLALPAGATEDLFPLPSQEGPTRGDCAYAGPTSLALSSTNPPGRAPAADRFALPLVEIHLGYAEDRQEMVRMVERELASGDLLGLGDQGDRTCWMYYQSCYGPYATGDCCNSPEVDREAYTCYRKFICDDGGQFEGPVTFYNCVGAVCH